MPELPEVETMKRGIAAVMGSRIIDVTRCRCRLKPIGIRPSLAMLRRRARNQQITGLSRVGKRVVLELESGRPDRPGTADDGPGARGRRRRIAEHCGCDSRSKGAASSELLFWDRRGLGSVQVYTPAAVRPAAGRISGLAPMLCWRRPRCSAQRLGRSRRRDQGGPAGPGSRGGHRQPVRFRDPAPGAAFILSGAATSCGLRHWELLHGAIIEVLQDAIRHEGSTLSDGTYRNALNEAGSYQNQHRVYDRAGEACRRCGQAEIVRIVQAQRSTFFCPKCQTLRKSSRPG